MEPTLETNVSLTVCDEVHSSQCLAVTTQSTEVDPTELGLPEEAATCCQLEMSLSFGHDSLELDAPPEPSSRSRGFLRRSKPVAATRMHIRFGIGLVDLRLK